MDIRPGTRITVEIVGVPTSAAGRKTLTRLCRKDPAIERASRKQTNKRPSWQEWRRGGMTWHHQMKSGSPVSLAEGAKYSIRATLDVIRDLKSVQKFVKVAGA